MFLGIPGRITDVWEEGGAPVADADFGGTQRLTCLAYLPDLAVGDYVTAHMGYALTKISESEALVTLGVMRSCGMLS